MSKTGKLFVVSAPSGTGKTTLCNKLLKERLPNLVKSISVTTRKSRQGEINGIDYEFISKEEFLKRKRKGAFLEHAKVFGNFYGTPKRFIVDNIKKGKSVLLSIDVQGAMQIKKKMPKKTVFIFVMPPSFDELKRRLQKRSTDNRQQVAKRLRLARKEISCVDRYDYVVLNDKVTKALKRLKAIINLEYSNL